MQDIKLCLKMILALINNNKAQSMLVIYKSTEDVSKFYDFENSKTIIIYLLLKLNDPEHQRKLVTNDTRIFTLGTQSFDRQF